MALRYLGADPSTSWLPGIPARDMLDEEASHYPGIEESALYELVDEAELISKTAPSEDESTTEPVASRATPKEEGVNSDG